MQIAQNEILDKIKDSRETDMIKKAKQSCNDTETP